LCSFFLDEKIPKQIKFPILEVHIAT
jgi:hypothetical protein